MNRWMKNRNLFARLAHASPWAALALSLFLATLATRIPAPSLRAADDKAGPNLIGQTQEEADRKSAGCISCHTQTDEPTMHTTGTLRLGCTDCHGGNAEITRPAGAAAGLPSYETVKQQAHPRPRLPDLWRSSANPVRPYTQWLKESPEYIRFVNPGDLRIAAETCGSAGCHASEVRNVST